MKSFLGIFVVICGLAGSIPAASASPPSQHAEFVVAPEVVIHHTPDRSFIGPGTIRLENGDLLMAAPWGRPPTNFEQLAATFPVPMLYRSTDGGSQYFQYLHAVDLGSGAERAGSPQLITATSAGTGDGSDDHSRGPLSAGSSRDRRTAHGVSLTAPFRARSGDKPKP